MSRFDEKSYRAGVWVGQMIGAVANGCREMSGTWPDEAMQEDKDALVSYAAMHGLAVTFEGRWVTVAERKPPKLEIVK